MMFFSHSSNLNGLTETVPLPNNHPKDCQVFCGLPMMESEFRHDAAGHPARFANLVVEKTIQMKRPKSGWTGHQVQSVWQRLNTSQGEDEFSLYALLHDTLDYVESQGGQVIRRASAADFQTIAKRPVLILLSHHAKVDQVVEFRCSMTPCSEAALGIPPTYAGTVDLSLCNTYDLHDMMKFRTGDNARYIIRDRPLKLDFGLILLRLTVSILANEPRPYIQANRKAFQALREAPSVNNK